jgi:KTSC domain
LIVIETPESSNVESIAYDEQLEELSVTFRKSGLYVYESVPQYVWDELVAASSKGGYVNASIKPRFGFHQ